MRLTPRQNAHVLAALRYCQGKDLGGMPHFDGLKPLDDDETNVLCEQINRNASSPSGFTVVGLYPDTDWDGSMQGATFVEWVDAPSPIEAARMARHRMARIRLSGSDEPADADLEKEVPEAAGDFEVLCVFKGRHEDLYEAWRDDG